MREWAGKTLVVLAAVASATAGVLASVAGNASTGSPVSWLPSMSQHRLQWLAGSVFAVAGAALFGLWAQRRYELGLGALVPAAQRPESWMVDRPAEIGVIVRALCRRRGPSTVGVTTAVHGAGGFGKSTVAKMVRADLRVLRRFGGRVYWVTLGRDSRRGGLVEKVNDLVRQIDPAKAQPFADVGQAADHLATVLAAGPRRLVILDDVWFDDQLTAFPVAGRCTRLVTTRVVSLIATAGVAVRVDQMSVGQARAVLVADLPPLPTRVIDGLIGEAGRWPLLLRLINKILVDQCRLRTDTAVVAEELRQRLSRDGALQVDALTGAAGQQVDVTDPEQRRLAVAATIEASAGLLNVQERHRLAELAIFVEDEAIPITLVAALWRATEGLDRLAAGALCSRLNDLALLTLASAEDDGTVGLHDVVRDYLRGELGVDRLRELNDVLLHAVSADLPMERPLVSDEERTEVIAWWQLPDSARYLWDHLIYHLNAADRTIEADVIAADLRWVGARLEQSGAAGPFSDLAQLSTARAARLARLLGQIAHLLGPTAPAHSRVDVLYSRVAHDPDWGRQTLALATARKLPALANRWRLPDLAPSDLRRTLAGHTLRVVAVAVSPDGTWLASGARDGLVRIWDAVTGQQRALLAGQAGAVTAVAVSPDGSWLASGARDGRCGLDATTGQQRANLSGTGVVTAMAVSPYGTWLAIGRSDGSLCIWDVATAKQRTEARSIPGVTAVAVSPDGNWLAVGADDGSLWTWNVGTGWQGGAFTCHSCRVTAVAVSPDGTWLATAGGDGSIHLWDTPTGQHRAQLAGHPGRVHAIAVAADGTWLASAGNDAVRIWDTSTAKQRATFAGDTESLSTVALALDGSWLVTGGSAGSVQIWDATMAPRHVSATGHTGWVDAVAVAPNGRWLAAGSRSRWVRIWDSDTGLLRNAFTGHPTGVTAVAIAPDNSWLASGCDDGSVWIWEAATGQQRVGLAGHARTVTAVAVAPDGTWMATAGTAGWVRIWDTATGQLRTALGPHEGGVNALAVAPDGTWLATAGNDKSVQIWDVATGEQQAALVGDAKKVHAVAIAPDGTWLASGSDNGSIWIWDLDTKRRRLQLAGHTGRVNGVAVAPSGAWLVSVGNDRSVRIWNTANGSAAASMVINASARACTWSPCGKWVVVGGEAGVYHFEFKVPVNQFQLGTSPS